MVKNQKGRIAETSNNSYTARACHRYETHKYNVSMHVGGGVTSQLSTGQKGVKETTEETQLKLVMSDCEGVTSECMR